MVCIILRWAYVLDLSSPLLPAISHRYLFNFLPVYWELYAYGFWLPSWPRATAFSMGPHALQDGIVNA